MEFEGSSQRGGVARLASEEEGGLVARQASVEEVGRVAHQASGEEEATPQSKVNYTTRRAIHAELIARATHYATPHCATHIIIRYALRLFCITEKMN